MNNKSHLNIAAVTLFLLLALSNTISSRLLVYDLTSSFTNTVQQHILIQAAYADDDSDYSDSSDNGDGGSDSVDNEVIMMIIQIALTMVMAGAIVLITKDKANDDSTDENTRSNNHETKENIDNRKSNTNNVGNSGSIDMSTCDSDGGTISSTN